MIIVDVVVLAAGYALRVVAGAVVTSLPVAPWLLAFCVLFFCGLALLKRYAELVAMHAINGADARTHAYRLDHRGVIAFAGCASGDLAVTMDRRSMDVVNKPITTRPASPAGR